MTDQQTRQAREALGLLAAELAAADHRSGSRGLVLTELLPSLDLSDPPPELKVVAQLMGMLEAELLEKSGWTVAEFPLGQEGLRDLVIGQFLVFVGDQLEVLQNAFFARTGMDLEALELQIPIGPAPVEHGAS